MQFFHTKIQNTTQKFLCVCVYLSSLVSPFDVDGACPEKAYEEGRASLSPHLQAQGVRTKALMRLIEHHLMCTPAQDVEFIFFGSHISHA